MAIKQCTYCFFPTVFARTNSQKKECVLNKGKARRAEKEAQSHREATGKRYIPLLARSSVSQIGDRYGSTLSSCVAEKGNRDHRSCFITSRFKRCGRDVTVPLLSNVWCDSVPFPFDASRKTPSDRNKGNKEHQYTAARCTCVYSCIDLGPRHREFGQLGISWPLSLLCVINLCLVLFSDIPKMSIFCH